MIPFLEEEIVNPSRSSGSQTAGLQFEQLDQLAGGKAKNLPNDRIAHFSFEHLLQNHPSIAYRNNEGWKLRKVQLVGLSQNPQPVVYNTNQVPGMKSVKDSPTRELDQFEASALESLRSGEKLKIEKHGKQMRMMGPIFAGKRCATCHEQTGQMLGAFTYTLELVAERGPAMP
jgi:hypothetical protein